MFTKAQQQHVETHVKMTALIQHTLNLACWSCCRVSQLIKNWCRHQGRTFHLLAMKFVKQDLHFPIMYLTNTTTFSGLIIVVHRPSGAGPGMAVG